MAASVVSFNETVDHVSRHVVEIHDADGFVARRVFINPATVARCVARFVSDHRVAQVALTA